MAGRLNASTGLWICHYLSVRQTRLGKLLLTRSCYNRSYSKCSLAQIHTPSCLPRSTLSCSMNRRWWSTALATEITRLRPPLEILFLSLGHMKYQAYGPNEYTSDAVSRRLIDSCWSVMAHGDAREGKWRGNWRMEWVANTLHTTSEHGVSIITTADAHNSAVSSRLNWRPRRFKWTCPFRRKTKSGFCACTITFQLAYTYYSACTRQSWGAATTHLLESLMWQHARCSIRRGF